MSLSLKKWGSETCVPGETEPIIRYDVILASTMNATQVSLKGCANSVTDVFSFETTKTAYNNPEEKDTV